MFLSGLQKCTLLDYPGHIAAVVFTTGCNMRCRFCHNPEMVLPEKIRQLKQQRVKIDDFFAFLESRIGILDGVSICGGEPTLHRDLPEFIQAIKSLGFRVKLDTNGQNPGMLKELLVGKLIDYVAMDIKHTWEQYPSLVQIPVDAHTYQQSIDIIIQQAPDYEFRTTVIKGIHSAEDIATMSSYIRGAENYYLQNYRPEITLERSFSGSPFSHQELEKLQVIASKKVGKCEIRT